jgi:phenylalanyl-tRNA synthetase alpha chain
MGNQLKNLKKSVLEDLKKVASTDDLQNLQTKYLGRKGELTNILHGLKGLPTNKKPIIGKLANEIKQEMESAFEEKQKELWNKTVSSSLEKEFFDITIPGKTRGIGHIHPISQVQEEVERIFSQMGFAVMDGPEVESEYYNFEGLNIPEDHPARDMQDTFFIKDKHDEKHGKMVLRTHTSPVQIRTMEKYGAPLRVIVPGRTFRYEATDASHDTTFYQVEGMLIDKDISLCHLKGIMKEFLTRLFGKEVNVRFRPGYFPFVEPGLELDFSCLLCDQKGCRVCKNSGWIEFMGAGMIHENVLKAGGIDGKKYQGWAFGFGLTRLVMMRFGIDDIRLLMSGNLKFNRQF